MNQVLNHSKLAYKIWLDFIKDRKGIYFLGILSVFLTNVMQILAPKNIGWIIDFFANKPIPSILVSESRYDTFINLFAVLILSRVFINIFRFMWRRTLGRQTHHACGLLRRNVWDHVRFFTKDDLQNKYSKGVLMNAQVSDTNSARFIFGFTLVAIADLIFLGLTTFLSMAFINLKLASISFFVLLFVPYFVRILSRNEVEQYKKIQEVLGEFNDLSTQAISTIRLQRLSQTGDFWEKRLMESASRHRIEKLKGINISLSYIPVMGIAAITSYLILFVVGIWFYFEKKITVGEFISMQGLIFLLHDPLMTFGFVVSEWRKAFTALERLSQVYFQSKDLNLLNESQLKIAGEIVYEVNDLSFEYQPLKPVISNLNLQIKKGERLGILGPIGSGKSTLLEILSGIERKNSGEVKFFGRNFGDYSHEYLRSVISIVHQKPFLFADSIRANINLDQSLSDDQIWYYLDLACLKEDVIAFTDGLDTQLGEWGINLSGGQKQRLTLARALARKPEILLLDDCLSAVDTITEEKILKNLDHAFKDMTIIWVAHRKSTLKYCHRLQKIGDNHV